MQTEHQNRPTEQTPVPTGPAGRGEFFQALRVLIFAGVMALLFAVGLLLFLRPEVSESEKRELTPFPEFSWETLASGAYFNQINTWYADTYPGREGLIGINNAIRELFGIRTVQLVPAKPDVPTSGNPSSPDAPDAPADGTASDQMPIERLGSVYVKGSTAYEVYNETRANSERYAELIAQAAASLGNVKVYDIIVPLSASVGLSEKEQRSIGASDSAAAIDAMYAAMDGVTTVDAYASLLAHKDEYLYFRTDHHWTARGAYYAYTAWCERAGLAPHSLSDFEKCEFEGFLGTLYNEAGQPAALKNAPDTVEAWIPNGTNNVHITDRSGNRLKYTGGLVRKDTDTFYQNAAAKYNCFIMGDNPLTEIHNENITDGSSIVVVKESFGNALVPFLVDHYEYVHVIDYRYFTKTTGQTLSQYVTNVGADAVLFVNNLTATSATPRLEELAGLIG